MTMQTYKCHKTVRAGKIEDIQGLVRSPGYLLYIEGCDGSMLMKSEWIERHRPEKGGYLVEYEDGYLSYSPAKAFEDGYSLVG